MFIPGDIYTSSGAIKLYHCWTDMVTLYDSSSFYNWEQDDLPVYDLEERTRYIWEKIGYPTSAIPGIALVVSADAPASSVACNKNIFRSVSAAIEALPQTINFPVIIEIANFGQLGEINLNGIKSGPRGSLEIINRNFSRGEATASGLTNTGGVASPAYAISTAAGIDGSPGNTYNYLSGLLLNDPFYIDPVALAEITPMQGFLDSSCISISAAVFSGTKDARLSGVGSLDPTLNAYVSVWKQRNNYNRATLVIDDYNTVNPYANDTYGIRFKAFDLNPDPSDDISNRDASTVNMFGNNPIALANNWTGDTVVAYNGLYYGNKVTRIKVTNCDVPIYLRNFFLDGSGADKTDNMFGVEVLNSPQVLLENIVVTRYRKAGFKFENSTITATRGLVATRIYDFDSSGVRVTEPFNTRRKAVTFNSASGSMRDDGAAGLLAINSYINFSSTHLFETPLLSALLGGAVPFVPSYYIFEFTKCTNGMDLRNSQVLGGKSHSFNATPYPAYFETTIDIAHNTGVGLKAFNSQVELNGMFRLIENLKGAELNNSVLAVDKLSVLANQGHGIQAFNSNITYNKNLNKFHNAGTIVDTYTHPTYFRNNGQHLNLNNSVFSPVNTSSMEESYGRVIFKDAIGMIGNATYLENGFGLLESVKLENNSVAVFISPSFSRAETFCLPINAVFATKGSELHVSNNSKATLRGTKYFASRVFGPPGYGYSRNLIALAAENNSVIELNGPTVIAQFGIDLLADSNSKIQMSPPRDSLDNRLDLSSINLGDSGNHTAVELHAVRSCIVIDKHSKFVAKDLGSFITCWERSGDFSSLTNSGLDYEDAATNTQIYTSGGSLQFYPNPTPPLNEDYSLFLGVDTLSPSLGNQEAFNTSLIGTRGQYFLLALNTTPLGFSSTTMGGMCVRAVNDSLVELTNVNFPCGQWNASGPYYNGAAAFTSGGACFRPFIWNVADNSQMKADFLSVSGLYPSRAGYVGPYGYWASGGNLAGSGLPSSTPDTSSVSILDFYGANPSGHAFTSTSATNYGPFRIYFGIDAFANTLVNTNGVGYGIIPQIYSQGYQPSSYLVCSGSLSSLYRQSLQRNSAGSIEASGYYYGEDIVTNPGFLRVFVDNSAADTFANAKHCSVGKSNNAKVVSITLPYSLVNFGDSATTYGIPSLNMFDPERYN